uniref:Uncharacterized protein n=1 Tax=Arundo donax TaxID=35708 RepID=A0A0A9AE09_ARUDO
MSVYKLALQLVISMNAVAQLMMICI